MNKLIQSYIKDKYFVSTIYRESSTMPSMWYYETMAWEWNCTTKNRGDLIWQEDSGGSETTALKNHFIVCKKIIDNKCIDLSRQKTGGQVMPFVR